MARPVVLVAGRDPAEEIGGGHSSYVRAHGRAAILAGYEPHVFCVSSIAHDSETEYGFVHRVPRGKTPPRQVMMARHAPALRDAMSSHARVLDRAVAVHGFSLWTYAATLLKGAVAGTGRPRRVMSMFTTYVDEQKAQFQSLGRRRLSPVGIRHWLHLRRALRTLDALEKQAIEWSDVVLINYRSVQDLVLAQHPKAASKIVMGPYGTESMFEPPPRADLDTGATPLIVSIAQQKPKKGGGVLVEALAILRDRGVPFTAALIGGGEDEHHLRRQVMDRDLGDVVAMPGEVDHVGPWLARCTIYVQPSLREESGSMAVLEAMHAGCPVICSGIDGMAEDVRDGIDGIHVPPGDSPALADAIERLAVDPALRRRLGAAARQRFAERCHPDRLAASLQAAYEG